MSMQTDIIYGYGFEVTNVDYRTLAKFVVSHSKTIANRDKEDELFLLDMCCLADYEAMVNGEVECDVNGYSHIKSIIANIMKEETDISFEFDECNEYEEEAVLFSVCYPWNLTEKEKNITVEELENIIDRYIEELGINTTKGYIKIEIFG